MQCKERLALVAAKGGRRAHRPRSVRARAEATASPTTRCPPVRARATSCRASWDMTCTTYRGTPTHAASLIARPVASPCRVE